MPITAFETLLLLFMPTATVTNAGRARVGLYARMKKRFLLKRNFKEAFFSDSYGFVINIHNDNASRLLPFYQRQIFQHTMPEKKNIKYSSKIRAIREHFMKMNEQKS